MTIKVTLSDDVASYLEKQSLAHNKSCDQIADELIRQAIASDRVEDSEPLEGEGSASSHHGSLNPALDGKSLNQVLDDLYIKDYLEKARR